MGEILLDVSRLTKRFGGLVATNDLSLAVERGETHAIIGPNGAGKTTLFNMVAGALAPDEGSVRLDGRDITGLRADQVCAAGIARTFQIVRPFADMTVLENAMVGGFRGTVDTARARARAEAALAALDMTPLRDRLAASLTLPDRKRLEVARALLAHTALPAGEIAREAMKIAASLDIYTTDQITCEEL